jgi:hypothetical protein
MMCVAAEPNNFQNSVAITPTPAADEDRVRRLCQQRRSARSAIMDTGRSGCHERAAAAAAAASAFVEGPRGSKAPAVEGPARDTTTGGAALSLALGVDAREPPELLGRASAGQRW